MENEYPSCPTQFCGCVGYGFVPIQTLGETYNAANALSRGTVFPELNLNTEEYGKVCKKVGDAVNE